MKTQRRAFHDEEFPNTKFWGKKTFIVFITVKVRRQIWKK